MPLHCLILFNLSTLLFLTLGGNVCACDTSLHTTTLPAPVIAVTTPANTPTAILPSNYRAHPHYLRTADPAMPTLTPLTPSGDILPAAPSYPVPQGFQALVLLAATLRPRRKNPSSYFYDATTVAATSGSPANTYAQRRITQHHKAKTALYYYGYRYYDPVTGRWPSRDPIEEEGGNNLYAFVNNDGLNQWDYLGWTSGQDICDCVEFYLKEVTEQPHIGGTDAAPRTKFGDKKYYIPADGRKFPAWHKGTFNIDRPNYFAIFGRWRKGCNDEQTDASECYASEETDDDPVIKVTWKTGDNYLRDQKMVPGDKSVPQKKKNGFNGRPLPNYAITPKMDDYKTGTKVNLTIAVRYKGTYTTCVERNFRLGVGGTHLLTELANNPGRKKRRKNE